MAALLALMAVFGLGRAVAAAELASSQSLYQRGRGLQQQQRWTEALAAFDRVSFSGSRQTELDRCRRQCRLQERIARRYRRSSFVSFARTTNAAGAKAVLRLTYEQIRRNYHKPVRTGQLVEHGCNHLSLALRNKTFLRSHGLSPSATRTRDAVQRVGRLQRDAGGNGWTDAQAAERVDALAVLLKRELGLSRSAVLVEFAAGACEALDKYSAFLEPGALADTYAQVDGQFVGIGVELKDRAGGVRIVRTIPGSPAESAGVRGGDMLVGVDGTDVRGWDTDRVASLLPGPDGSRVRLTVQRAGTPRPRGITVTRARVQLRSLRIARMIDPKAGIAYIHLVAFQHDTATELAAAVRSLASKGMRALVLDLRGNPGGLLTAAVQAADLFIARGVLVSTRGRGPSQTWTHQARSVGSRTSLPLVVLVDGDTASAAEILAGAILDHKRGQLVGEPTYGKGTVQSLLELRGCGAGLRLTTAAFYTPSGRCLATRGLQPNVRIPLAPEAENGYIRSHAGRPDTLDNQLREGVSLLRRQLNGLACSR